jgi:phosphotriesterase-related protein
MAKLVTTLGPKTAIELGLILPHEHIFVEFRPPNHPEHAEALLYAGRKLPGATMA